MTPRDKYIFKKTVSIDKKKRIKLPTDLVETIYRRNQNNIVYIFEKDKQLAMGGEQDFFKIFNEGYKVIESCEIDKYGRILSNEVVENLKPDNKIQLFGGLDKIIIENIIKEDYKHFKDYNSTIDNVSFSYITKD